MRARYYAPSVGRFLSADTWAVDVHNPVELNRYVYAVNNPVRWVDPSGLMAVETGSLKGNVGVAGSLGAQAGGLLTRSLVWQALGLFLSSWYLFSSVDFESLMELGKSAVRTILRIVRDRLVKILYRGTSTNDLLEDKSTNGLWVTPHLWTAAFYSRLNSADGSDPVIAVYGIVEADWNDLIADGHIRKRFEVEYNLDAHAQTHLHGPITIVVPKDFIPDFHDTWEPIITPIPPFMPPLGN